MTAPPGRVHPGAGPAGEGRGELGRVHHHPVNPLPGRAVLAHLAEHHLAKGPDTAAVVLQKIIKHRESFQSLILTGEPR